MSQRGQIYVFSTEKKSELKTCAYVGVAAFVGARAGKRDVLVASLVNDKAANCNCIQEKVTLIFGIAQ